MPSRGSAHFDLIALLEVLDAEHVEYIVVGGVAATLHGSPRMTFDLAIVPEASMVNAERLARALGRIRAVVRDPARRALPLTMDLLIATMRSPQGGQLRLGTDSGPIDILWTLHDGRGYAELRRHSVTRSDDERSILVVDIPELVEIKRAAGRPQDLLDVQSLEAILKRTR